LNIDLNCDLGEGAGHDDRLMPLITSANIACGGHAGDVESMRAAVLLAIRHGVAIGAHPGFPDRANFGRREQAIDPLDAAKMVAGQIAALRDVAVACGARIRHVKPHGALYNQAVREAALAEAIAAAVWDADPALVLVGLAGSQLLVAGRVRGLRVASEVFADRTYQRDGSLTPRTHDDALITDEGAAIRQVLMIIGKGRVRATDGTDVAVSVDSVCIHGDGPHPVEFARRLRMELGAAGIEVRAL
jgi:UPF0271 protein